MLILLLCVITFIITLHVEYCQEHDAILKLKLVLFADYSVLLSASIGEFIRIKH